MSQKPLLLTGRVAPGPSFTPRALLSIIFRRRRVFWTTFFVVLIPVAAAVLFLPGEYESETKILVERQRADPVISSSLTRQETDAQTLARLEEQDIDSEIDLLESEDLLRSVVVKCDLWRDVPKWRTWLHIPPPSQEKAIAKAVRGLRQDLIVEPPNKSNIVTIHYHSHNPGEAARVLTALSNLYQEKHLQVHRPAGSTEFFEEEVARNRQAVQEANAKLEEFTKTNGVVAADTESSNTLEKMAQFEGTLQGTRAQILSAKLRIANLQAQMKVVPVNITTRTKTSPVLIDSLKSTLYSLELKRTELLTKYQPGYRVVKDIEKQIADTKAAMTEAERAPTAERTTEQDPVHVWLNTELAKAKAELVALQAAEAQTQRTVSDYHSHAMSLENLGHAQQDLLRNAKAAEEAYVAALRKQSEAKMSEALDRSRIMNISVAEPPTTPVLPTTAPMTKLIVGFCLALFMAIGMAFLFDYWDPSFRTPYEVETVLDVPVLAVFPYAKGMGPGDYDVQVPGRLPS